LGQNNPVLTSTNIDGNRRTCVRATFGPRGTIASAGKVAAVINRRSAGGRHIGEIRAYALGNPEACDDTPLDLLASLASRFAGSPILPSGLIEMGNKSVALDGCRLK
jgi:hypothetical protein